MSNIVKIKKKIIRRPVFNMTVDDYHNYMIQGGVISKNCDALRAFCVWWVRKPDAESDPNRKRWNQSMWEDYNNASAEDKAYLISKWGEPIR